MMPYTYPTDYQPPLAEATADAFWSRPADETSGSYELRIDDDTDTGGIVNTDDDHGWLGHSETILEQWADILYEQVNRPFLDWA